MTEIIKSTDLNWLEFRKSGIGASDIATVCKLNPYQTLEDLWNIKKGLKEYTEGDDAKFGKILEPFIIQILWNEKGRPSAIPNTITYKHRNHENLFCTPDAIIGTSELLQIKLSKMHKKFSEYNFPEYFNMQLQFEMEVMDIDKAVLLAVVGGDFARPKIYNVERDFQIGAALVKYGIWFCSTLAYAKNPFFENNFVGVNNNGN